MRKEVSYQIQYPVAAEITLGGEEQPMLSYCLAGLKLAVKEQRMAPEKATEYFRTWFEQDYDFEAPDYKVD
jgi:hypothetical protein